MLGASEYDEGEIVACAEGGVSGYHLRTNSLPELIQMIASVVAGESACSPRVAGLLMQRLATVAARDSSDSKVLALTHRETQIVDLLELGLSNKEIAAQLSIEVATVKNRRNLALLHWLGNNARRPVRNGTDVVIFPAEIKINVDGGVDEALSRLGGAQGAASKRQIWFGEDRIGVEDGNLPLSHAGVTMRFRSGDKDDLTAKLRPCLESQLVNGWSRRFETDSFEYRIEGDWSEQRRLLAASAVSVRPPRSLLDAVGEGVDAAAALSAAPRLFLDACGVRVEQAGCIGTNRLHQVHRPAARRPPRHLERWTRPRQFQVSSQTPDDAAVIASTSADTPKAPGSRFADQHHYQPAGEGVRIMVLPLRGRGMR